MSTGFAFHMPPRASSVPAGRAAWTAAMLTLGSVLLFAGCAGSTATATQAAPTQAATATVATTTDAAPTVTTAATAAAPTAAATTPAAATAAPARGSITFAPSTISCADSETIVTITWTLAPGTSGDQAILFEWDGSLGQGGQMPKAVSAAGFTRQTNGSWKQSETTTGFDICTNLGAKVGSHKWSVVEAQSDGTPGAVLAEGSFKATA
jgi:hypothetical protein